MMMKEKSILGSYLYAETMVANDLIRNPLACVYRVEYKEKAAVTRQKREFRR
jgi:hypothetical protein